MPILRMETDLVRNTGSLLQQTTDRLSEQTQQLQQSVKFLSNQWQGSSRDIFIAEVESLLRQMFGLVDSGVTLNQRLQREVDEWEQAGSQLGGAGGDGTVVTNITTTGEQVPDSVLTTVLKAEEQWQEDLNFVREWAEEEQDNFALENPREAFGKNQSIGRYNIEPKTAKEALEWAFQNSIADEYGFSEMPSDEEIVKLIMNKNSDSKLVALRLSQLKDMHPQLREMSWGEINSNPNYVAKLYSGYMGAGGAWDQWLSNLEPGPEAKERLNLDSNSGGGGA
ncbi:MAG: WXG100 family type VII secretion target [Chloroflexi bacterium]|nr:WXG100 family type VII secretion target [Chloroflexota bacterium]